MKKCFLAIGIISTFFIATNFIASEKKKKQPEQYISRDPSGGFKNTDIDNQLKTFGTKQLQTQQSQLQQKKSKLIFTRVIL